MYKIWLLYDPRRALVALFTFLFVLALIILSPHTLWRTLRVITEWLARLPTNKSVLFAADVTEQRWINRNGNVRSQSRRERAQPRPPLMPVSLGLSLKVFFRIPVSRSCREVTHAA